LKYILLIPIKMYWAFIPASKRNTCLFNVSCSNHVFNITAGKGLLKGIKALIHRYKNCRPGYQIMTIDDETYMISANHEMFPLSQLRQSLFS